MNITSFIFSRSRKMVWLRHTTFWIIWILFYGTHLFLVRHYYGNAGVSVPVNIFSSFTHILATSVIDMAYVYFIIYLLIPRLFFRARFLSFFGAWFLTTLSTAFLFRLQAIYLIIPMETYFGFPARTLAPLPNAIFSLFVSVGFEGCMAAAIVLGKHWYKSNQHVLQMKSERKNMDYRIRQTEKVLGSNYVVREVFRDLTKEINRIACKGNEVEVVKSKAAFILEFLNTYFENANNGSVPLSREIDGVQKFISIKEQENFHFEPEINKSYSDYKIASNILLPLTALPYKNEESINRDKTIKLKIDAHHDAVSYFLSWNKKNINDTLHRTQYEFLKSIKRYLEFNYPSSHKLSVSISDSTIGLLLNIRLKEGIM